MRDTLLTKMIKSLFAAGAALSLSAGAAVAGPYVEIENNAGWVGNDYSAAVTDFHVGYEGDLSESASYYVQAGPALVSIDGEDSEGEWSGKAGVGVGITEQLSAIRRSFLPHRWFRLRRHQLRHQDRRPLFFLRIGK